MNISLAITDNMPNAITELCKERIKLVQRLYAINVEIAKLDTFEAVQYAAEGAGFDGSAEA